MTPITTCQRGPRRPTSSPPSFIITPGFYCRERWRDGRSKESDSLPFYEYKDAHCVPLLCNIKSQTYDKIYAVFLPGYQQILEVEIMHKSRVTAGNAPVFKVVQTVVGVGLRARQSACTLKPSDVDSRHSACE